MPGISAADACKVARKRVDRRFDHRVLIAGERRLQRGDIALEQRARGIVQAGRAGKVCLHLGDELLAARLELKDRQRALRMDRAGRQRSKVRIRAEVRAHGAGQPLVQVAVLKAVELRIRPHEDLALRLQRGLRAERRGDRAGFGADGDGHMHVAIARGPVGGHEPVRHGLWSSSSLHASVASSPETEQTVHLTSPSDAGSASMMSRSSSDSWIFSMNACQSGAA